MLLYSAHLGGINNDRAADPVENESSLKETLFGPSDIALKPAKLAQLNIAPAKYSFSFFWKLLSDNLIYNLTKQLW